MISIVLLHQKSSSSMFRVKNTFPSKHGMKGPRLMQNRIPKFNSKLFPTLGVHVRNLADHFSACFSPNMIQKTPTPDDGTDRNVMDWTHVLMTPSAPTTCPRTYSQTQQSCCCSKYIWWGSTTTLNIHPILPISEVATVA